MPFRGDTKSLSLGDVFQNLLQNKQTGTLTVSPAEGRPAHLYFLEGVVTHYSPGTDALAYLPTLLRKRAGATDEEIEKAVKKRGRSKSSLTQVLVKQGAVTQERATEALRFHSEEAIYDLFALSEATFEFQDGAPDPDRFDTDQRALDLKLDTNKILFEAARRQDEWGLIRKKILSLSEVFAVPTEKQEALKALEDKGLKEIGRHLDGSRTVADAIEASAQGAFAVCKGVMDLLAQGLARPVGVDELAALAEKARRRGDAAAVVRFCRQALERERNRPEIREQLASALEKLGEREPAASEWKLLAATALEANDVDRAVAAYRKAIACLPRDTSAREALVRLLGEKKGAAAAQSDGRDLALTYRELGLLEKARDTYRKLREMAPDDPDLPRFLAEAHVEMGDVAGGVRVLHETARAWAEGGNPAGAKTLLTILLKLQPEHAEGKALLREIDAGTLQKRLTRQRRRRRVVVGTLGACVVIGYAVYDGVARFAGEAAGTRALAVFLGTEKTDPPGGNRRAAAAKVCRDAAARFPFTRAWWLLGQAAESYEGALGPGLEIRALVSERQPAVAATVLRDAARDLRTTADVPEVAAGLVPEVAAAYAAALKSLPKGEPGTKLLLALADDVGSTRLAYRGLLAAFADELKKGKAGNAFLPPEGIEAGWGRWQTITEALLHLRAVAGEGTARDGLALPSEDAEGLRTACHAWLAAHEAIEKPPAK